MKLAFRSEMGRNANATEFRIAEVAVMLTKNGSCTLLWNVEKCKRKSISDIQNGH